MIGNLHGAKWPPEHDIYLHDCFENGMTGREAAGAINKKFRTDYSRNAIIGRAMRLKIKSKNAAYGGGVKWSERNPDGTPKIRPPKPQRLPRPPNTRSTPFVPKPVFAVDTETGLRAADVQPLHLSLLDLQFGQCRWPYGDGPFTFCGHPVLDGSYCFAHQSLSYRNREIA